MADEARIRQFARAVADELANRHMVVSLDEARALVEVENSNAEVYCANCGWALLPESRECPKCHSRKAVVDAPFRCASCKNPVSLGQPQCSCGNTTAIKTRGMSGMVSVGAHSNPVSFSCANCLEPVAISQPRCSCGGTRCYLDVEV